MNLQDIMQVGEEEEEAGEGQHEDARLPAAAPTGRWADEAEAEERGRGRERERDYGREREHSRSPPRRRYSRPLT